MATREGLKAVAMFEAIERGEIKALWVMATNPAGRCRAPTRCAPRCSRSSSSSCRRTFSRNDTVDAGAQCCCPPPPGARRTAPSPIPSGAFRASGRSCRRPARRSRIGGSSARSRAGWALAPLRLGSAADIFREHAALSAFENDGSRDFDIGGLRASPTRPIDRSTRCSGRCAPVRDRASSASSPMAAFSRPIARRASSRPSRRAPTHAPIDAFPLPSTPAACATSGTR